MITLALETVDAAIDIGYMGAAAIGAIALVGITVHHVRTPPTRGRHRIR